MGAHQATSSLEIYKDPYHGVYLKFIWLTSQVQGSFTDKLSDLWSLLGLVSDWAYLFWGYGT